jgi:hypothetical protein
VSLFRRPLQGSGGRPGRGECPRTPGLIDRLVAGSPNDEDRRHAPACGSCAPVMARAARFQGDLERSAQHLIAEDMPGGMLDPELTGQVGGVVGMRSLSPGAFVGVGALAVLVFATVVGIRPVLMPGSSPTQPSLVQEVDGPNGTSRPGAPLFSLGELTVALSERLHFECGTEEALESGADVGASAVCTAPADAGPFTAAVVLHASASGMVEQITITATIEGGTSQAARDSVAAALARVTSEAFTGARPGARAANFVFAKASQLSGPAWAMGIEEGGVRVDLQRQADGGYLVHLSVAS